MSWFVHLYGNEDIEVGAVEAKSQEVTKVGGAANPVSLEEREIKEIFEIYSPPLTPGLFSLMLETNSRMDSEVIWTHDTGSLLETNSERNHSPLETSLEDDYS